MALGASPRKDSFKKMGTEMHKNNSKTLGKKLNPSSPPEQRDIFREVRRKFCLRKKKLTWLASQGTSLLPPRWSRRRKPPSNRLRCKTTNDVHKKQGEQ